MEALPDDVVARFGLSHHAKVDETGIATVWKVKRKGEEFALKLYKGGDLRNEAPGFDLLRDLDGRGATRVIGQDCGAILLEWLEGASLGDLVRAGDDEGAAKTLVEVAGTLHATALPHRDSYPTLEDWFAALFALEFTADCPETLKAEFLFAQDLARELLATQTDVRPLHGDLHHDNIKQGARGWLAFDAKGVVGERTYELANAMRNPKGAEVLMREPERIRRLRDTWSDAFDVSGERLMQWAVAKSALSIAWSCNGRLGRCDGDDLVGVFAQVLRG